MSRIFVRFYFCLFLLLFVVVVAHHMLFENYELSL